MDKIAALWGLFRQGSAVANPAAWKAGQISATVIGGLVLVIVNLAKAFGYDIPISTEGANAIGVAVLVIVNSVLTVTTTTSIGMPPVSTPNETNTPTNIFGGGSD